MSSYVGIDVGKIIGVSIFESEEDKNPRVYYVDRKKFIDIIKTNIKPDFDLGKKYYFCLEKVHSMPKQGVVSTFNFGESFGFIKGILEYNDFNYELIEPRVWRKATNTHSKKDSIEFVKKKFENVELKPTKKSRVDNHNMADAVCIGYYQILKKERGLNGF